MTYKYIIDQFTWSYSRLTTYEFCKYKFLLSYIYSEPKHKRNFFSDHGLLIHRILEKYFKGELKREELLSYYLTNYKSNVIGSAPNSKIFSKYFNYGIQYFTDFNPQPEKIVGVEHEVRFGIKDNNSVREFTGFIDTISFDDNGNLIITDHKSRDLKQRSGRQKPTVADKNLDSYLRQLYLYSIPLEQEYGRLPDFLRFNCFRTGNIITEPFILDDFYCAQKWAVEMIHSIESESEWEPNIDYFKCRYLCDYTDKCDFFGMFERS